MRATHRELITRPSLKKDANKIRDISIRTPMPSPCDKQVGTAINGDQASFVMPKDIICSFDSLYKAAQKCKNNVMWKDSTAGFMSNYVSNIVKLRNGLLCSTYKLDSYTVFFVYEPKMRQIVSTRIKDRVFQRSTCDNYLYKEMTKHFIYDNCACQSDKDTDMAIGRLKRYLQRFYRKYNTNGWILKCDIKDFFGQTPHKVVLSVVQKRVDDEWDTLQVAKIIKQFLSMRIRNI